MSDQFLEFFLRGQSAALVGLRNEIYQINVAHKRHHAIKSVLLVGERGTGKSQLAEIMAAHLRWLREFPDGSGEDAWRQWTLKRLGVMGGMRRQTLTALPDDLAESALFGHRKGSYTGAVKDRDGVFRTTGDVDLLLDEIGDASLVIQGKLLEVLQTGQFRPIGASWDEQPFDTQVRVLAATNRDLSADVLARRFRADLLDRLSTFVIRIPSLREGRERIPAVLENILEAHSMQFEIDVPHLSEADFTFATQQYNWPGNIRELEHAVLAWFVRQRQPSLRQIVLENAQRLRDETSDLPEGELAIRNNIRSQLELVSRGGGPRFETFGDFSQRFGSLGVEVLDELNQGGLDLSLVFSCGAQPVQSQLSGWRKRRGTVRRRRRSTNK